VTDEPEYGPDPNDVRRHAKKMHTEIEYRKRYRRIDFYKPNLKQIEFHNTIASERALRAGNQLGKTHATAAQMVFDALNRYPSWYKGRRFEKPPPIERPFDFLGWVASTTSATTRDGMQTKLLGDIRQEGGLGTGLIPLDYIVGRPTMARGISDFVDSMTLRRETGGTAVIRQKTYEQDRKAYQGEPVDEIALDEDVSRDDETIYGECLARLATTRGQIICSLTPMLGLSPLRKRFKERAASGECVDIIMTIYDAAVSKGGHIPDADIPIIIARYKESERGTRAFGLDMQGEGAVFEISETEIKHKKDPATFPHYFAWMWAFDFSHAGMSAGAHPFAAVLGAWDRDNDVIYIVEAIRMRQALPVSHVARIKQHPRWDALVSWPHDGGMSGFESTETFAQVYKRLGLKMRPTHATFKDGGFSFESGISEMEQRFATGRLKIAEHLSEVFDEFRGYHRINGLVHKVDDDLMSAIRVLCMDIRFAKTFERDRSPGFTRDEGQSIAYRGGPLHPEGDFDVFG
jgi:phage terminase large subunit-like protein